MQSGTAQSAPPRAPPANQSRAQRSPSPDASASADPANQSASSPPDKDDRARTTTLPARPPLATDRTFPAPRSPEIRPTKCAAPQSFRSNPPAPAGRNSSNARSPQTPRPTQRPEDRPSAPSSPAASTSIPHCAPAPTAAPPGWFQKKEQNCACPARSPSAPALPPPAQRSAKLKTSAPQSPAQATAEISSAAATVPKCPHASAATPARAPNVPESRSIQALYRLQIQLRQRVPQSSTRPQSQKWSFSTIRTQMFHLRSLLFVPPVYPEARRAFCAQGASRSNFAGPTLFALAFAPFYRLLEFFKLLTGHGLPYLLITER